jgi:hypothetical protein
MAFDITFQEFAAQIKGGFEVSKTFAENKVAWQECFLPSFISPASFQRLVLPGGQPQGGATRRDFEGMLVGVHGEQ